MTTAIAKLTDEEFDRLIGSTNPMIFSARLRAESLAQDIRNRVASVAADLRQWIAAGEIADALPIARIANEFEHLAHAVGAEVGGHNPVRWMGSDTDDAVPPQPSALHEYEIDAWHSAAND